MKNSGITLYAYNFRSRAERVMWALNELNISYKLVRLDPSIGETNADEFIKLSRVHTAHLI